MKLKQILGFQFIRPESRRTLEAAQFPNLTTARRFVEKCFPNHVVVHGNDSIVVTNRDKSFTVATFREV